MIDRACSQTPMSLLCVLGVEPGGRSVRWSGLFPSGIRGKGTRAWDGELMIDWNRTRMGLRGVVGHVQGIK